MCECVHVLYCSLRGDRKSAHDRTQTQQSEKERKSEEERKKTKAHENGKEDNKTTSQKRHLRCIHFISMCVYACVCAVCYSIQS